MEKTEGIFISHCDNPSCDLGCFYYICPKCAKKINDYVTWWKQYDIIGGDEHNFKCEICLSDLVVKYNSEEFEFLVYLKNE